MGQTQEVLINNHLNIARVYYHYQKQGQPPNLFIQNISEAFRSKKFPASSITHLELESGGKMDPFYSGEDWQIGARVESLHCCQQPQLFMVKTVTFGPSH